MGMNVRNGKRFGVAVAGVRPMEMDVDMPAAVMPVLMHVNTLRQSTPGAPEPNADEDHADDALGPAGDGLQRKQIAKQQRQKADRRYSQRVTEAPPEAGDPGALAALDRQRRNSGEMIRTGKDMGHPGNGSSERRKHGGVRLTE